MKQRTQTRKRVVVTRRIFAELVTELRDEFEIVDNQEDVGWQPAALAAALKGADAALITSGERIDDALLDQCRRLKIVANIAVGYNNIDLAACTRHGVLATNTPDVLSPRFIQTCSTSTTSCRRRISHPALERRAERWQRWRLRTCEPHWRTGDRRRC